MRYLDVENQVFTDVNNVSYTVKGLREIESNRILFQLNIGKDTYLDEVASRENVYTEDNEDDTYKLFDANASLIFENNFNLDKINKLNIPER